MRLVCRVRGALAEKSVHIVDPRPSRLKRLARRRVDPPSNGAPEENVR